MKIKTYENIDQERILVARDKAELRLVDYRETLKYRYSWRTPLGWIFSFGTALASVDRFRDVLFVPAEICEAALSIGFVYSILWLIATRIRVYRDRNKGDIDELLNRLGSKKLKTKKRSNTIEQPMGMFLKAKMRIKRLFERW